MPDWILFFVIVVGIPVVFGVLGDVGKRWLKLKEKQLNLAVEQAGQQAAQSAARMERLEQRVRVLERIVTDRSGHLAEEIERLRDEPLN
ncbi:hypothetical protein [Pedomonas mirosovicensis]|uniref:hypothetical protein n=1 Tax=Pedomonas mirosovicensis TaxID=2908641 RepID=UPI00216A0CBA|nr:hypothetical protein [Pedomonas mirosovicensis]MCH8686053.1 hypothetical protein [Pedomonas mirosovicensis]